MDHQSLVPIAQRAILQVLNYHFISAECGVGLAALDRQTRNKISGDIQKNLALAAHAEDRNKAYLEIVCDAALPVAEKHRINKRWFYTAVQGLTSMELVPGLYENAAVPIRLSTLDSDIRASEGDGNQEIDSDQAVEQAQPPDQATTATATATATTDADAAAFAAAAAAFGSWRPWTDDDMREMIDLKFGDLSIVDIANKISRPHGLVYRIWLHASENTSSKWFKYIHNKFRAEEEEKEKYADDESGHTSLGKRKRTPSL